MHDSPIDALSILFYVSNLWYINNYRIMISACNTYIQQNRRSNAKEKWLKWQYVQYLARVYPKTINASYSIINSRVTLSATSATSAFQPSNLFILLFQGICLYTEKY